MRILMLNLDCSEIKAVYSEKSTIIFIFYFSERKGKKKGCQSDKGYKNDDRHCLLEGDEFT